VRRRRTRFLQLAGLLLIAVLAVVDAGDPGVDAELLARVEARYGAAARERVAAWDRLIRDSRGLDEREQLERVNRFFNALRFTSDLEHWGEQDYWATPIEFLATAGGDCEDFSVAKYFTLRELGIPEERLRLTYVKALKLDQAHMVLTWQGPGASEPLVLDNLVEDIRPASRRGDLRPVYSFNGEGLWLAKARGRGQKVGSSDRIGLWKDLKRRMHDYRAGKENARQP